MSYKITIVKLDEIKTTEKGEWAVVNKRPWTDAELSQQSSSYSSEGFLEKNPLKEIRDYTPDRIVTKQVETKVLEQTVETIDFPAVITAINGLKRRKTTAKK